MLQHWPVISDEAAYNARIFNVRRRLCRSPKDGQGKEIFVIDSASWVVVAPITPDGQMVLVRQFRHGSGELSLELPGGIIDPGQTPLISGQRELREETGYTAPQWRPLTTLRPNPALFNNTTYGFVAEGAVLTEATAFDENEDIELVLAPVSQVKAMITDGRIDHAIMVAVISAYLLTL